MYMFNKCYIYSYYVSISKSHGIITMELYNSIQLAQHDFDNGEICIYLYNRCSYV